jgi:hypothetical protein
VVPTLQPGAKQVPESRTNTNLRKARNRLSRSGSTRDAGSAIEQMMP